MDPQTPYSNMPIFEDDELPFPWSTRSNSNAMSSENLLPGNSDTGSYPNLDYLLPSSDDQIFQMNDISDAGDSFDYLSSACSTGSNLGSVNNDIPEFSTNVDSLVWPQSTSVDPGLLSAWQFPVSFMSSTLGNGTAGAPEGYFRGTDPSLLEHLPIEKPVSEPITPSTRLHDNRLPQPLPTLAPAISSRCRELAAGKVNNRNIESKKPKRLRPCDLKKEVKRQLKKVDKPEICDICMKGFAEPRELKRHYLVHHKGYAKNVLRLNVDRVPCIYPSCEETFSRTDHRTRHIQRKHGR